MWLIQWYARRVRGDKEWLLVVGGGVDSGSHITVCGGWHQERGCWVLRLPTQNHGKKEVLTHNQRKAKGPTKPAICRETLKTFRRATALSRKFSSAYFGKEAAISIKYKLIYVFVYSPNLSQKESKAATKHCVLDKSHHILEYELNSLGHQSSKTQANRS